jgi:cell division protein FtsZ
VLRESAAPVRVQIGERITKGLGVGGNPSLGQKAAEESIDIIRETIKGADMIFITAGMGGGTGTGAAPVVAQLSRAEGILTVGVVTKPFGFEGQVRMSQAEEGINNLKNYTDTLIVIPNERVFNVIDARMSTKALYEIIDDVLRHSVQAITDVITVPGEINMDFADVKNIIANSGTALIGIGESSTSDNVKEAIVKAISSPLLDNYDISLAEKMLINVTTNSTVSALKIKEIGDVIKSYNINGHIYYGHAIDNRLDDKIRITVIATGFKTDNPVKKELGQATLFDDNHDLSAPREMDFSKPAYTYWKMKKLK